MSASRALSTTGPVAFISGGSSGIGLACARQLLDRGWRVVIAARSTARLAEAVGVLAAPGRVIAVALDVADVAACAAAIADVERDVGAIDLLITSAGIAEPGLFLEQDLDTHLRHLHINYVGTLALVHAVVPAMKARRRGRLLLVSSGAAFVGIYGYAAYAPSKFAVRGLAETLHAELVEHGITTSISYPPDTDTPQYLAEQATKPMTTKAVTAGGGLFSADVVAKRIVDEALQGRFAITHGATLWVLRWLHSLVGPLFLRWQQREARRHRATTTSSDRH